MPVNADRRVATPHERIDSGERGGTDRERDLLLAFSDRLQLLRSEYSDNQHLKLLNHCVGISEHCPGDLSACLEDREAAEDIVRWINATYDNEEVNRDYRVALRMFGKRVTESSQTDVATGTDDMEFPGSVAWITSTTCRELRSRAGSGRHARGGGPPPSRSDVASVSSTAIRSTPRIRRGPGGCLHFAPKLNHDGADEHSEDERANHHEVARPAGLLPGEG